MSLQTLRAGIVSDIHLGFAAHSDPHYYGNGQPGLQESWWEQVLRWYREKGVDVMLVPGDLSNAWDYKEDTWSAENSYLELKRFYAIWQKVFGGTDTRLFCINGNHDELVQQWEVFHGGKRTPWEDVFGEPYAPVLCAEVNGYRLVGAHWGQEKLAAPILKREVALADGMPVFFLQHGAVSDTVVGSESSLHPDVSNAALQEVWDCDNVIVLSGHTHCPITDPRAIWQRENTGFTSITCGTLNYGCTNGGTLIGDNLQTKQSLYMIVTGKDICIQRLSFWTEAMRQRVEGKDAPWADCAVSAGSDWHFTVGEKPYTDARRQKSTATPAFSGGAILGVFRGLDFANVMFPAAQMPDCEDFIQSYLAEAVDIHGEVVSSARICTPHHTGWGQEKTVSCYQITVPNLKGNTAYRFRVYAVSCLSKKSLPLQRDARTLEKPAPNLG